VGGEQAAAWVTRKTAHCPVLAVWLVDWSGRPLNSHSNSLKLILIDSLVESTINSSSATTGICHVASSRWQKAYFLQVPSKCLGAKGGSISGRLKRLKDPTTAGKAKSTQRF
jgi:hypothetical protein